MRQQAVVLVTGVSSGIGKSIAGLLAQKNFRVFGTTRSGQVERSLENVSVIPLDVRNEQSVHSSIETVLQRAGRIDALVNNAGYALLGAIEETSIEEAQALFETNFFGVLRMNRAVLPIFRKQGYGRIVNIGSSAGFVPLPYQGIYSATKHAIAGYSESLDHEVRQFGIRVSVVAPGFTKTNIAQNAQFARNLLDPYQNERSRVADAVRRSVEHGEDPITIASTVLEALTTSSPRTAYLAGRDARVTSLLKRFAPSGVFDKGLRKQFGLSAR